MISLAVDAFVLIALLKLVNDNDVDLWTAVMVAIGASLGTMGLIAVMKTLLGESGIIVGLLLAPVLLGGLVAVLFSIEIKRAALIAVLFTVAHIGIGIGVHLLFGR